MIIENVEKNGEITTTVIAVVHQVVLLLFDCCAGKKIAL